MSCLGLVLKFRKSFFLLERKNNEFKFLATKKLFFSSIPITNVNVAITSSINSVSSKMASFHYITDIGISLKINNQT